MSDENRLLDLVVRWEETQEAGHGLTPEELCRDCPELLPELKQRLDALRAMNSALHTRDSDEETLANPPGNGNKTLPSAAGGHGSASQFDSNAVPGYVLVRELGRGGMGLVYLARQMQPDRFVALKMLLAGRDAVPTERIRFDTEVEAISRVRHPNLVEIYEVGEHDGCPFFSMEYLEGGSLDEQIGSRPQDPRQAAELAAILARAIHVAHQHGIVHRDLKPANVLFTSARVPKIVDFGLAKRRNITAGPTRTLHILGTPSYMAPEQAMGRSRNAGPGADVYSLGAILYQMVTGQPPFLGQNEMELILQVVDKEPQPPRTLQPDVPADLEAICLKCLRKQPAERYASAADLADDLGRFLAHEPIEAKPVVPDGPRRRRWHVVAGLLAVVIVLAVLLAVGWDLLMP